MPTVIQTATGANNFSGTGTDGVIEFATYLPGLPDDENMRPIITGISLGNENNEALTFNCFLRPFADANTTSRRKTITRPGTAQAGGFNFDGCEIFVDRQIFGGPADLRPWTLILITTGSKTVDASFTVSFKFGKYQAN